MKSSGTLFWRRSVAARLLPALFADRIRRMVLLFLAVLLCGSAVANATTEAEVTDWEQLILPGDSAQDRVYAALSDEEKGLAGWVVFMEESRPERIDEENAPMLADLRRVEAALAEKGFSWRLWRDARNAAAADIVPAVLGKRAALVGFLLPAVGDENTAVLVPWISVAAAAPPPPPNQAVVVVIPQGIAVPPAAAAVAVSGILGEQRGTTRVEIDERQISVATDYGMTAESITGCTEEFQETPIP